MPLVLSGAGAITGLTSVPSSGLQLADANMPTGSVLQVIQGTITSSQVVVAAANPLVSTGISATITPQSASSKILVIPVITNLYNLGAGGAGFAIYRNDTNVYVHGYAQSGGYLGSIYNSASNISGVSFPYLDSPSTASAVTYTLYWGAYQNTQYINYQGASTVNGTGSYITLMEIAG